MFVFFSIYNVKLKKKANLKHIYDRSFFPLRIKISLENVSIFLFSLAVFQKVMWKLGPDFMGVGLIGYVQRDFFYSKRCFRKIETDCRII